MKGLYSEKYKTFKKETEVEWYIVFMDHKN